MTVYGNEKTAWGTVKDGFYVVCCKCGWHSHVVVEGDGHIDDTSVWFYCKKCENSYHHET